MWKYCRTWEIIGGAFEWAEGSGPTSENPTVILLEDADYQISLTHVPPENVLPNNCNINGITSFIIEAYDIPSATLISDDYFICEGDQITSSAINIDDGNLDDYDFEWYLNETFYSNLINPITYEFQTQGINSISGIISNICGSSESTIQISVNETPIIEIISPPVDCIGNTVVVEASGADTYQWTNNNQVSSQTGNPVEYIISETTTEIVVGVLNHAFVSCESEETFEIIAHPLPQIDILGDPSICDADTLVLTADISSGTPDYSISWSEQNSSSLDSILITEANLGLNYVIADVVDANGCESTEGIGITVYDLPIVEAGANVEFCDQPILTNLEENDPLNGYWDGLGIIDQVNGTIDPSLIGVGTSIINYNYTDSNGCSNTDSLTVTIVDPVFANAGPDIAVCDIDTTLTVSGFTPTNGQWIDNSIDSNYNLDVSDLGPGIYPYIFTYGEKRVLQKTLCF